MRKIKTHIFAENLDDTNGRTWQYGKTMLTSEEMERVKKRLPENAKIITINFADPADYVYPGITENEILTNFNNDDYDK